VLPHVQEVVSYAAEYCSRNALARVATSGGDMRHFAGLLQVGRAGGDGNQFCSLPAFHMQQNSQSAAEALEMLKTSLPPTVDTVLHSHGSFRADRGLKL
jgi:hypothetical protein